MYTSLWEYEVKQDSIEAFLVAYGPDGAWVRLFSRSGEYVKTELHCDSENPCRFLTIDYWKSEGAHERFRDEFLEEYTRLDESCAGLTEGETFLGYFRVVG